MLKRTLFFKFVVCLTGILSASVLIGVQSVDCPQIVETALNAADEFCTTLGRNQACYGHVALDAELQGDVEDFTFEEPGDVLNVAALDTLRLSPMNVATGEWGVALMSLQANLPDALPGQNVIFLMFGDVEIQNTTSVDLSPRTNNLHAMQAFRLRTGFRDAPCEGAPQSGLVVQTPQGAGTVVFNINGVDVEMGSTVFFQANADEGMTVSTLEGAANVSAEQGSQPVLAGTWVRVPLDDDYQPSRAPGWPRPYTCRSAIHAALPLELLPRSIEIAPAMENEQFDIVQANIEADEPLCGQEGLPDCETYPFLAGEHQCLLIQGASCD
ncbi:MAG: hypothetical protein IPO91_19375 [Chloroflexi bacterium]|jgi:hypothetical protein|nr:hypothetical protein [Chloroflexota bacterium]